MCDQARRFQEYCARRQSNVQWKETQIKNERPAYNRYKNSYNRSALRLHELRQAISTFLMPIPRPPQLQSEMLSDSKRRNSLSREVSNCVYVQAPFSVRAFANLLRLTVASTRFSLCGPNASRIERNRKQGDKWCGEREGVPQPLKLTESISQYQTPRVKDVNLKFHKTCGKATSNGYFCRGNIIHSVYRISSWHHG